MPAPEWSDATHIEHYLSSTRDRAWAVTVDQALLEQIPEATARVLDLGTGDGRLLALLLDGRPQRTGVGLDASQPMLERARRRFAADARVELIGHDLDEPLPELGRFDAVVSSLAIHHLEHPRKRSLYAEAFALLDPGGVFVNYEHVASPSERLHHEFFAAIEEPLDCEDPSDRLLGVEMQLGWLRAIGFEEVDCHWKWRELALMAGRKPARGTTAPSERSEAERTGATVRDAAEHDWPTIWRFIHQIVAAGETIGYAREMTEQETRAMWLAAPPVRTAVAVDAKGAVVGSSTMHANRAGPGAHVASATYMVDPARQGHGFGRALVLDSLDWARGEGFRAMQFNAVVETNVAAVRLYESLGFEVVGTVPEAFRHPRHGFVALHVMHRRL